MSGIEKWEPVARIYNPLKAGSIDGTDTVPHDHGVVRAMESEYKPNKLVVGDPKATVFVGRLNPDTTEDTLQRSFSKYGRIKRMRIIRDIVTGFSKGYAFVEYSDKHDVAEVIKKMNKRVIDDREILVDAECERLLPGWIPRRLGGGLSGKKESGQLRFGGIERPFRKPLIPFKCQDRRDNRHDAASDRSSYNSYRRHDSNDSYNDRHYQRPDYYNRNREKNRQNHSSKYRDDRGSYRN